MSADEPLTSQQVTVYSTTWCGYCITLKRQLRDVGIAFAEVNIDEEPAAADFVTAINGGNRTVPTVRFADGTTLTNPRLADVRLHLASLAS